MSASTARDRSASPAATAEPPVPRGALRRLWIWFALAPIVWAVHEMVSYVAAYNACRAGGAPRAITIPVSLVAIALVVVATVALARGRRRYPHADITGGTVRSERAAFLALFGGVLAALTLIGVVLDAGAAFVEACR
ncbi:MAG TPA: hypothetical protein VGD56_04860 [Gemmatirosa sp.]